MDLEKLSRPELEATLHRLQQRPVTADEAQRLVHELQVHRAELEMQNRALRETQQELEFAVHRYADLYHSLPIAYVTLGREGRILEANQAAGDLLGVSRERLPGTHLRQYVEVAHLAALSPFLESCATSCDRQTVEVALGRGGRITPIQIAAQRTEPGPGPEVRIRAALIDLSELKETQRTLDGLIAEQENFAYSISHDLRSPLLTIKGFAAMLADERESLDPAQVTEIIGRLNRAAGRMDALLTSLLDYTRVSRRSIPIEPVNLAEVVSDVLLQHRAMIDERKAMIEVQAALPVALASRGLLSQAFANLLTNALKFTDQGKRPVIRVTAAHADKSVVLIVADEGIGIAAQHHERIFRIFERLHGTAVYPGTGIGLALVRRAAERMRGRVWVESEEGKGARFYLELPRA
jgi:PAS domain S-box-containing protein